VAQRHPEGTMALMLAIQDHGLWMVAIHDGAVIVGTDRLFASSEEAQGVIDQLAAAYPGLRVVGPTGGRQLVSLDDLVAACAPASQLRTLSHWDSWLPWPVQCLALALVLSLLVPRAWSLLQARRTPPPSVQAYDPVQAWRQAIDASVKHRFVHGVAGTRLLLTLFHDLPVGPGGWALHGAECTSEGRLWQCQADYRRQAPGASNATLFAAVPPNWSVDFPSLDQATRRWREPSAGTPLLAYRLTTRRHTENVLYSSLQGIRQGFGQLQVGPPQRLPFTPPADRDGLAMPRPVGLPAYSARSLQLGGPLRSAGLLLPHSGSIAWTKAALSVRHTDKPDLTHSALALVLHGVLYETDIPTVPHDHDGPPGTMAAKAFDGG